jgi:hypothetical protein
MDLEKAIMGQVGNALKDAITKELVGYNKPLSLLTQKVITANEKDLFDLINGEFSALLNGDGFRDALKEALNQKLAKTLINRMGGELEKQVNNLKQNPQTRAQITLAISKIIEEL